MDIASILAAADEEVAYEKDAFEEVPTFTETNVATVSEVLKSAAQAVVKTEEKLTSEVLSQSAVQVHEELEEIAQQPQVIADKLSAEDTSALNVLVESSEKVQELYGKKDSSRSPDGDDGKTEDVHDKEDEDEETEDEVEEEDEEDADFDIHASQELLFACYNGDIKKVQELLRKGANIRYIDRHGWNAIHWTSSKGDVDVMECLLTHRKNEGKSVTSLLRCQDSKLAGWTALHIAAVCGHLQMARFLLKYGASKRKKDRMGEIPFDVVGKSGNAKALRQLLNNKPKGRRDTSTIEEKKSQE